MKSSEIQPLLKSIEQSVKFKVSSPTGFQHLSALIFNRTKANLSVSTLKRIWGYVEGYDEVRDSTVDILCQFIGYSNFADFSKASEGVQGIPPSNIMFGDCLYADELRQGKRIRLTWSPGRVCDVEYQGNNTFIVLKSELTKLIAGSTFRCSVFETGGPLYISNLYFTPDQKEPVNYVAGQIGGINYEEL